MKTIWIWSGRVAFWLAWPLLFLYLARRERTRVIIACRDEILVVKGWLSRGRWSLPGGGLHAGEDVMAGALREVREETALQLSDARVQYVGSYHSKEFSFRYHLYVTVLPEKPTVQPQKLEIVDVAWLSYEQLVAGDLVGSSTIEALRAWTPSGKLLQ